jgi:hypothetical protein
VGVALELRQSELVNKRLRSFGVRSEAYLSGEEMIMTRNYGT